MVCFFNECYIIYIFILEIYFFLSFAFTFYSLTWTFGNFSILLTHVLLIIPKGEDKVLFHVGIRFWKNAFTLPVWRLSDFLFLHTRYWWGYFELRIHFLLLLFVSGINSTFLLTAFKNLERISLNLFFFFTTFLTKWFFLKVRSLNQL